MTNKKEFLEELLKHRQVELKGITLEQMVKEIEDSQIDIDWSDVSETEVFDDFKEYINWIYSDKYDAIQVFRRLVDTAIKSNQVLDVKKYLSNNKIIELSNGMVVYPFE